MNGQVGPKALWRNLKNEAPDWAQIIPSLPRKISALIDENRQQEMRDAYIHLVSAAAAKPVAGCDCGCFAADFAFEIGFVRIIARLRLFIRNRL